MNVYLSLSSRLILVFGMLLVLSGVGSVRAEGVLNTLDGIAIRGYDPVAYFTMDKAARGTEEFVHEWLGATWHFVNAKHRDLFAADPTRYAPQHGGFCSSGATEGVTARADPEAWRIVDKRLYLFYSKGAAARFDPDSPAVAAVDEDWRKKLSQLLDQ